MYIIIFLTLIALILFYKIFFGSTNTWIQSNIDNEFYLIRRNNQSTEFLIESANILALVHQKIQKLITYLQQKYPDYLNAHDSKHFYIKFLSEKYHRKILSEGNVDKQYTTYTIDKGDIRVCLRTRDSEDKPYDINLLLYVLIHELAHLCNYDRNGTPIIGHGIEFVNIFRFLIQSAIEVNVYKYVDYSKKPVDYCDMELNSQIV